MARVSETPYSRIVFELQLIGERRAISRTVTVGPRRRHTMTEKQISKRELLKKAAYVAPAILTLKAVPSFAKNGSGLKEKGNNGVGNGYDPPPPGNPRVNDGEGTEPGDPGNKKK